MAGEKSKHRKRQRPKKPREREFVRPPRPKNRDPAEHLYCVFGAGLLVAGVFMVYKWAFGGPTHNERVRWEGDENGEEMVSMDDYSSEPSDGDSFDEIDSESESSGEESEEDGPPKAKSKSRKKMPVAEEEEDLSDIDQEQPARPGEGTAEGSQ